MLEEREFSEETPWDERHGACSSCLASRDGVGVVCASREDTGDRGKTGVEASFFVGCGSSTKVASEALIGGGGIDSLSPGIWEGEAFPRDEAVDDTGDLGRDVLSLVQEGFPKSSAGIPHVG
jgi:hypothetical protein